MHPSSLRTKEPTTPKALSEARTPFLTILFTFLVGLCASIFYGMILGLETIRLGALASIFLLPPVIGYHAFDSPTDSPRAKHIAFFTIVLAEITSCAALYFYWKSIPIPKFSSPNLLYWPFVRTQNDGYVGDAVLIANQCFLTGVTASYLAILAYPRITKFFDSSPRSV